MRFSRFLPILSWLPKYKRSYLKDDILAGVTVGIILVPQGMAYALLAGLPPIYGLYAGIVPLIIYALFGTSRQMSVGPVALVSLLVLAGVGQFAETDTELFIGLAISTALIAGVVHVLLGVFKLGFLVNFLSRPVISGLTSAAAIIIGFSQLRNLLRLDLPRSNQIYEIIRGTIQHIGEIHWLTFSIGMGGILVILALKWWKKSFPASLAVIVLSVLLVGVLGLEKQGIEIVGDVPPRLPSFGVPDLSIEMIRQLMPLALTICLVSFIESLAVAKSIEARHSDYRVVPNQELIALGISKIAGAFFQSYPTSGSFTRSAIND
ncbi:MAG: SulP family inorganic anion transporter, partial [Saprospiraceae bacterium]|nr:SulP family inorganic anion transporter [Saprospiraceae bacterium]